MLHLFDCIFSLIRLVLNHIPATILLPVHLFVLWSVVGWRLYWPGGWLSPQVSSTPNNKTSDPSNPAAKARVSPCHHIHPHSSNSPQTSSRFLSLSLSLQTPAILHQPRTHHSSHCLYWSLAFLSMCYSNCGTGMDQRNFKQVLVCEQMQSS